MIGTLNWEITHVNMKWGYFYENVLAPEFSKTIMKHNR